jgi:hypothetical protein
MRPWFKNRQSNLVTLILSNRDLLTGPETADRFQFAPCANTRLRVRRLSAFARRANGPAKTRPVCRSGVINWKGADHA